MVDAEISEEMEPATDTSNPVGYRVLRVWPAILLVVLMVAARTIHWLPAIAEDGPASIWMASAFGPMLCGIGVVLWWLFASRAGIKEKLLGLIAIIVMGAVTIALVDRSMHGPPIIVLALPLGTAAFAAGTTLFSHVLAFRRVLMALATALVGFGFSTLLRNHGMWGNFGMELDWRWVPSGEDRLADRGDVATVSVSKFGDALQTSLDNPEWQGFRGENRDGRIVGSAIDPDWAANPPKEIWKIDVGPGWSSFAVAGPLIFTQEQRGDLETVVCYTADSGQEAWTHTVESRFIDALGGDGPRATPTIANGDLFVVGATGHVMRLDAKTGEQKWQADLRELSGRKPPMWEFCSSPLVVGNVVVVHAGGKGDKGILALNVNTGELVWSAPSDGHSYSSPQLSRFFGQDYVAMLTSVGLDLVDPESGDVRLGYQWNHGSGYRSLQPLVDGNRVLLPTGMGVGTQSITLASDEGTLSATEDWSTLRLKPDFNDMVTHGGAIYGFDGDVFTCVDLESGKRNWKRGRYGKGQVILLPDQDLLLVLTETGEALLLQTNPEKHTEVARMEMITGRTWTHPVLIGDRLYVRNSSQAACFQLPTLK